MACTQSDAPHSRPRVPRTATLSSPKAPFEDGGDRDVGVVERVLDQPPAALRALDGALRFGVDHPPAGAGIEGQVDADAAQLAAFAGAARVLAVGEALAQSPQPLPVRGTEHVDQRHRVLRG